MATPWNNFDLPVVGADADTWGGKLNTILTAVDVLLSSPSTTIKGNGGGPQAATADLTPAQVQAILPAVVGDSGAGGAKGSVPAPAAGDAAARKVLGASGAWVPTEVRAIGRFNGTTGVVTGTARGVSIVRTGVGIYDVTLSPAMADTNYIIEVPIETINLSAGLPSISAKTTGGFTVTTCRNVATPVDPYDPAFISIKISVP